MNTDSLAPGKPGIAPTWCSSCKDAITTGLGNSRVWATLGRGILNEVYWPSTGQPQIRDLGFIVAKGDKWCEVKRLNRYKLSTPKPFVLLPTVSHEGTDFSLTLAVVCDDLRDVVLVRFNLVGDGHKLFALLAPRLGSQGRRNTASCRSDAFVAAGGDDLFLYLGSSCGFRRQSAGYVGKSDGWSDFQQHRAMTWTYQRAEQGNVAVMGELDESDGVIAIGFGTSICGAETLARASLADGFDCVQQRVADRWEKWAAHWDSPDMLSANSRAAVERSAAVLKACDDRLFPGAIVASPSIPWGNARNDLGGYHLVWARDSVEAALGMIAVSHYAEARQLLAYLIATQQADGHWTQNFFPDGAPYYRGVQLDETSFPVLLAAKLFELNELEGLQGVTRMVNRALGFLLRAGPVTPQDRWEENEGISPFTLSLIIAAIVGSAPMISDIDERGYLLSYADYLNCRIEDWLYVQDTSLAQKYGVDGYYLRLATPQVFSGFHGELTIANDGGVVPEASVVALDFLYLARLGLRQSDDPKISSTLKVVEGELRRRTPHGPAYYRYNGDCYGEHHDGSPFDGTGKGRLWPLLTGERGHFAVQSNEDATDYLHAMCKMAGQGGLIPEQIWDDGPKPEFDLYFGQPTGSANPLVWAHAELVKLATAIVTKKPVELLEAVRTRYGFEPPAATTWHWRTYAPFRELPANTDLLVEAPESFDLHFGFNGWHSISDRQSQPLGFGMHGVRLTESDLRSGGELNLTVYYKTRDDWEHVDHGIRLSNLPTTRREKRVAQVLA